MPAAQRPNVLFVVADQFRADLMAGALAGHAKLPNLRGLAADAVEFRHHFSVVTPCGPSRASLLTGQYAMNHRAVRNGTPLRHDTPNLALEARKLGYEPLLFGYTDITQDPRALPPDDPRLTTYEEVLPGFREVVRMRQDSDDRVWRKDLAAKGYAVPEGNALYRPADGTVDGRAVYAAGDSDTAYLTDRFLDHMAGAEPGWFAHLTWVRPHPPFVAPAPYNRMHDWRSLPAPAASADPRGADWHQFNAPAAEKAEFASRVTGIPGLEPTPETVARIRAVYLGLAEEVDYHFGRVIGWLKGSGQYEPTIIVFTSDHGEALGDYGLWGKMSFYDAAFHVPLIIRAPEGLRGEVVEAMSESVDVAPTLLELIGARIPDTMDGMSLRPFLRGSAPERWRTHTFSEVDLGDPIHPTPWQRDPGLSAEAANLAVLRTGRHRLVQFGNGWPQILFDMEGAGEGLDISADAAAMPICLDLSRRMLCHRMVNAEGTFARTLVVDGGVRTGTG